MNDVIQNLGRLLRLICDADREAANVAEITLSAQSLRILTLYDQSGTCETPSNATLESQCAALTDFSARLSEAIVSRASIVAPCSAHSGEVDPVSEMRSRSEEGTIFLEDSNIQLRERLQEFQDAIEEKETVITAQVD